MLSYFGASLVHGSFKELLWLSECQSVATDRCAPVRFWNDEPWCSRTRSSAGRGGSQQAAGVQFFRFPFPEDGRFSVQKTCRDGRDEGPGSSPSKFATLFLIRDLYGLVKKKGQQELQRSMVFPRFPILRQTGPGQGVYQCPWLDGHASHAPMVSVFFRLRCRPSSLCCCSVCNCCTTSIPTLVERRRWPSWLAVVCCGQLQVQILGF